MVINRELYRSNDHVKFISYTGRFPNLCRGVLTLEIDGERHTFGHIFRHQSDNPEFERFWESGGDVMDSDQVWTGEWRIDWALIPEQFRKYADEIDRVFNENVEYGCCGGCA